MKYADPADDIVGRQILCDCWDCEADIGSAETVLAALKESTRRANVTLLEVFSHEFSPGGFTAVAMIAESHIFIHTWPEKRYVAVDVFTCGTNAIPERAIEVVREVFAPSHFKVVEVKRRSTFRETACDQP